MHFQRKFHWGNEMKIGILGSEGMGGQRGVIFSKLGHEVTFSYSRSEQKLAGLVAASGHAKAGTPRQAAEHADLVLLAVHWLDLDDVLVQAGDLSAKLMLLHHAAECQQQRPCDCSH
ncbi:NAD(P)-binding domain-containing protein [Paraburkholderia graminis]|uniref:NAD(P)-binding domain-containing protein n=2 Tax=Paraburkholderia TaxID=1822464 RepID=UPI0019F24C80|nr:NAD(P)-binding domain-containing protein [Paraburkholderia graminis]